MKNYITLLFILTASLALAQKPDLTGKWNLTTHVSLSGKDYIGGVPNQLTIQQSSSEISIQTVTPTAKGDATAIETIPLNGEVAISKTPGLRKKTSFIKWADDQKSFTKFSELSLPNDEARLDYKTTEVYNLSADKTTLTIVKTFESATDPNDKWSQKGTYQKQ